MILQSCFFLIGFRHPINLLKIQEFPDTLPRIDPVTAFSSPAGKTELLRGLAEMFKPDIF